MFPRVLAAKGTGRRDFAGAILLCLALLPCFATLTGVLQAHAQTANPLLRPSAIAFDAAGNLYIADPDRNQVLEATLAGTLLVVAGNGTQGFAGDGGPATAAQMNKPQGLAFGPNGTLYLADTGNARIRAVTQGTMTTFGGTGASSYSGDGGPAIAASFRLPTALAIDGTGALLVCDTADHRIRRIRNGTITTFAGNGLQGFSGDGAAAAQAEFDSPSGLAVAPDGRVFIADTHNQRIRVVSADGLIGTYAGTGQRGSTGDAGTASAATLSNPRGLALTSDGALLIADADSERIRSVDAAGVMHTLAGAGVEGTSRDGALGAQAALHAPRALAVNSFGMPVLADTLNGTVRVLTPQGTLFQPAALAGSRASSVTGTWPATLTYGQGAATLQVGGIAGTPQGMVTLSEGVATLAKASLATGSATLPLPSLSAGAHTLTATYAGDGLNPASTLRLPALTVAPAPVVATANAATAAYGATLPALTGTLTGVLPQDAGEVTAIFTANTTAGVGSYPIAIALTGPKSSNYTVSLAPASGTLQVTPAGTQTLLGSITQSYAGVPLQLSANVVATTAAKPTGSVQFLDGNTVVGTGMLVNGSASALYTSPAAGTRTLVAQYGGDRNFAHSTSAVQMATVSMLPDFGIGLSSAATATVQAGSAATYSLVVSAQPTPFTGVVTLSVAGLPPGATANFTPVQVVPGTGSATVTVNVQTSASQALLRSGDQRTARTMWAVTGLGLCLCLRRRRRVWLLGISLLCGGCGARTVGEAGLTLNTRAYTLSVTGTPTNLLGAVVTHATNVTLAVQN